MGLAPRARTKDVCLNKNGLRSQIMITVLGLVVNIIVCVGGGEAIGLFSVSPRIGFTFVVNA